jgi:hypothetical protein
VCRVTDRVEGGAGPTLPRQAPTESPERGLLHRQTSVRFEVKDKESISVANTDDDELARLQKASTDDDELIARLQEASKEDKPSSDPFLSLPIAKEVPVSGGLPATSDAPCKAPGRRSLPVPSMMTNAATEPIQCELPKGHSGAHRARFTRTRFLRRWRALEWLGEPISG